MKNLKKLGLASAGIILAAAPSFAVGVGSFAVDVTTISADILAVGGVMVGLSLLFLTYKWTRRMLAR